MRPVNSQLLRLPNNLPGEPKWGPPEPDHGVKAPPPPWSNNQKGAGVLGDDGQ